MTHSEYKSAKGLYFRSGDSIRVNLVELPNIYCTTCKPVLSPMMGSGGIRLHTDTEIQWHERAEQAER